MDKFEYYTDLRCINHGLGFQLLSWSKEVREKLKIQTWNGAKNPTGVKERYMDPSTIERYMKLNPVYLKMKM